MTGRIPRPLVRCPADRLSPCGFATQARSRTMGPKASSASLPREVARCPTALSRLDRVLRLYDTQTREVRDFVPLEEGKAGLYVCGLTVQSEPHVGHVRSAVNFDVLQRWLRHRGYDVTFIRNVTDIDDKILVKAAEQGRPWYNLAYAMRRELDQAYDGAQRRAADLRAGRHRPRAGDARADRPADREGPRLRRRRRLGRRLLRRALVAGVRRADPPEDRRHGGGRGRRPARQARPARLRALEGLEEGDRAGDRRVAEPVGTGSPGLAHRVLRDGRQVPRPRPSTSTAAASTCASRTTRTSRPSPARPATRSRRTGCTTPGSPPPARR